MKQSKICALYSRLSRDDEQIGESGSIQMQKSMLEDYAAKNGFSNIEHFVDDGFSGGNFERPSWKRLIAEIENGNVQTVISKDMSRVGREYLQTGFYTEVFFREKGVRFIAIANNIDSQNQASSDTKKKAAAEHDAAVKRQNAYHEKHAAEIEAYKDAEAYLKAVLNGRTQIPTATWQTEQKKLIGERFALAEKFYGIKDEIKSAEVLRRGIEELLRGEVQRPAKQQIKSQGVDL